MKTCSGCRPAVNRRGHDPVNGSKKIARPLAWLFTRMHYFIQLLNHSHSKITDPRQRCWLLVRMWPNVYLSSYFVAAGSLDPKSFCFVACRVLFIGPD